MRPPGPLGRAAALLFPARCQGCGRVGAAALCDDCLGSIPLPLVPRCRCCGDFFDPLAHDPTLCADCRRQAARPGALAVVRSAAAHSDLARRLVHRLKYQRRRGAAEALGRVAARWLACDHEAREALPFGRALALVPVPLHRWRRWWRGFNQARLLADALAPLVGVEVAEVLVRIRYTRSQVGLKHADRGRNVKGAFAVQPDTVTRGAAYVLVDDVYTSGATLRECATVLRRAGAGTVAAVTLARPVEPELVEVAFVTEPL